MHSSDYVLLTGQTLRKGDDTFTNSPVVSTPDAQGWITSSGVVKIMDPQRSIFDAEVEHKCDVKIRLSTTGCSLCFSQSSFMGERIASLVYDLDFEVTSLVACERVYSSDTPYNQHPFELVLKITYSIMPQLSQIDQAGHNKKGEQPAIHLFSTLPNRGLADSAQVRIYLLGKDKNGNSKPQLSLQSLKQTLGIQVEDLGDVAKELPKATNNIVDHPASKPSELQTSELVIRPNLALKHSQGFDNRQPQRPLNRNNVYQTGKINLWVKGKLSSPRKRQEFHGPKPQGSSMVNIAAIRQNKAIIARSNQNLVRIDQGLEKKLQQISALSQDFWKFVLPEKAQYSGAFETDWDAPKNEKHNSKISKSRTRSHPSQTEYIPTTLPGWSRDRGQGLEQTNINSRHRGRSTTNDSDDCLTEPFNDGKLVQSWRDFSQDAARNKAAVSNIGEKRNIRSASSSGDKADVRISKGKPKMLKGGAHFLMPYERE